MIIAFMLVLAVTLYVTACVPAFASMTPKEIEEFRQYLLGEGLTEDEAEAIIAEELEAQQQIGADQGNDDNDNRRQDDGTVIEIAGKTYPKIVIDDIVSFRDSGYTDDILLRSGYTQEELDAAAQYTSGRPTPTPGPELATDNPERDAKLKERYDFYRSLGYSHEEANEKANNDIFFSEHEYRVQTQEEDRRMEDESLNPVQETVNLGAEISAILKETDNPLKTDNVEGMSRLDYIATYAASGKYNRIELNWKINELDASDLTFAPHPSHYFTGTPYEEMYNSLATANDFKQKANSLTEEVKLLKKEYLTAHQAYESWKGTASELELSAMESIMNQFDSDISDLEKSLKSACDGLNILKGLLDKIKNNEKKLFQLTGVDGDGSPIASQPKDCLYLLKKQQEELQAAYDSSSSAYDNLVNNPDYGDNDKPTSSYNKNLNNAKSKMNSDKSKLDRINKDIENKDKLIEKAKTELDKTLEEVILTIFDINSYDSNLELIESYLGFDPGDKGQPNEHYTDWESFKTHTMHNYHDMFLDNL